MKTLGRRVFQFRMTGRLRFDPAKGSKHHDDWWALLEIDEELAHYYRWMLFKGKYIETHPPNKLWGFHSSVIKGEKPTKNIERWGEQENQEIEFWYGNHIGYNNGRHAWINLYSEELCEIREFYGLITHERKLRFHATLGRLVHPTEPDVKRPGTVYDCGDGSFTL